MRSIASGDALRNTWLGQQKDPKKLRAGPYLVEWMRFDLRKFVLHVIGIHCANLLSCRCTKHFDDFHKLIDS